MRLTRPTLLRALTSSRRPLESCRRGLRGNRTENMNTNSIYELSGGDITVWVDNGVIMLKVREPFGDPVELNEHEALELADLLARLARTG